MASAIATIFIAAMIPFVMFVLIKSIWLASKDLPITWYMIFRF